MLAPAGGHPRNFNPRPPPEFLYRTRDRSSLHRREPIEARFLLISERTIEFFQSRLHDIDRAQHGVESLLHGVDAHHRSDRPVGRAIRLKELACLRDSVLESA